MPSSTRVIAAAAASALALGGLVGLTAPAAQAGGRACPAENFFIGDGWGADRGSRSHQGIDLGGQRGSSIFAIEDGVIDRTKRQSNGALQIVMRGESGAKFYYGHMDDVVVKGGQRVAAGDVIGTMGDSGSPGAVHLHFEFWRSGGESAAVDPAELIDRVCSDDSAAASSGREPGTSRGDRPKGKRPQLTKAIKGNVFSN